MRRAADTAAAQRHAAQGARVTAALAAAAAAARDDAARRGTVRRAAQLLRQEELRLLAAVTRHVDDAARAEHRLQQREEGLARLLRGVQFQLKHAADNVDPELAPLRTQQADLEGRRARVGEMLRCARGDAEAELRRWAAVEERLEEAGVEFTPPSIAHQRRLIELRERAVAAAAQLAEEDARRAVRQRGDAASLATAVAAAGSPSLRASQRGGQQQPAAAARPAAQP